MSGFSRVLESAGFSLKFPGSGKLWKMSLVLESPGNLSLRSWKVLEFLLVVQINRRASGSVWAVAKLLPSLPDMHRTPRVNKCTKYSCYVVNETVLLQIVMNILQRVVPLRCISDAITTIYKKFQDFP